MRVANGATALFLESTIIDHEQKNPWVCRSQVQGGKAQLDLRQQDGRTK
jgi:hypothetical protein